MNKKRYTPQMVEFVRQNFDNHSLPELVELFNNHFDLNITKHTIIYLCHRYRILRNVKYTKEMDSFLLDNYKIYTKKRLAQEFNKKFGCNKNEYTLRHRVHLLSGDFILHNYKIISKARYLFIKYFGDEIPLGKNDVVIFKDGNKENISKDNLMKVDKDDLYSLCGMKLYNIDSQTTEAGLIIAQIMRKLGELKRHKDKIKFSS